MVNSPPGEPKLEAICRRITKVWNVRKFPIRYAPGWRTMEAAHAQFTRYDGLGGLRVEYYDSSSAHVWGN